jgi:formate-dependent nitrite reductase cytochrome c552 subunit
MITAIIVLLLMLFIGIRFSKKYRRIRHHQWHVRDWIKTQKNKLTSTARAWGLR